MPAPAQPTEQGPYLTAALLCERVLVEQDGVKSAIRIIDRVIRTAMGPNPPERMEPFDYQVFLMITLKSGWARGSYPLRVCVVRPPESESRTVLQQTVLFEGEEDRGVELIGGMTIRFELEGIYWFEVLLAERLLTRIPLRVVYVRKFTPTTGPRESSPPPPGPESGR